MVRGSTRPPHCCVVIANPIAGRVSESLVDKVAEHCSRFTPRVRVHWAGGREDARNYAFQEVSRPSDEGTNVIVSVGGDGTTWEVVSGMTAGRGRPRRHALMVIPAGTGNSNYRSHWGETPWPLALEAALGAPDDRVRHLDLAWISELARPVVLGAGAGLTAQVLQDAREVKVTGPARLEAGLARAAARFTPYEGRVTVDGTVVHEGPTVFANVGGGRFRAWQYDVLPRSVLDDGLLDVCIAGSGTPPAALPGLLRTGRHVLEPGAVYTRGRQVVLERLDGAPLCFEHDGELLPPARSRYTLEVVAGALPVLCSPAPDRSRAAARDGK
ncbi:diacylglycerol/lipid kinase family protein [Streptomyces olivoverticillatus]|uniref:diacylglycerol/lipid kinase family protein n=1 Tax=Streptomyces olivoverticillatus TaxID=66427 RepID=UPI00161807E0|nr:diacylglycerol kinase family protein [Streptomyces olivoverticillatus]